MKKLLLWGLITVIMSGVTFAQDIVTTRPQKKAVVLEEFTGINCPACPYGHAAAEELLGNYPEKVFIINIHTGYYATPSEGQPDYRTSFGSGLEGQSGLGGYPSATINRHLFVDLSEEGGTALYRDAWPAAADRIFEESSPVNLGVSTVYNSETREVSVTVEAYYVEGLPFGIESNFFQVALVENHVIGYQNGGGSSYDHKHMLRHLLTGQWGDEIEDIEAGTVVNRTYTYTLDEEFVAENCNIVAFITETKQEVLTGVEVPIIDGLHNGEIESDYGRLFTNEPLASGESGIVSDFDVTLINGLNESQNVTLSLDNDAPADWDVSFSVNEVLYTESASLTLDPDEIKNVVISVTPGTTVGVAHCELTLTSDSYPAEPEKIAEVFVVSGVDNLIVNGSGTSNSIVSSDYQEVYTTGLSEAGCNTTGAIPGYTLEQASELGLLANVDNIYMNIGGTLPVLTEGQADVLTSFVNDGGNILIAGQDIGKDIWGTTGTSTGIKQKMFYQNYISASYLDDGASTNNAISSTVDSIYSGITSVSLYNAYSDEFAPDEVKAYGNASEILYYPNGEAAGVKNYKGSGKVAYFAFGLEQIQDENSRNDIIDRTYQWFTGWEGSDVSKIERVNLELFPNPVTNELHILDFENESVYTIFNISGQVVKSGRLVEKLDVSELNSGIYFLEISDVNNTYRKKFTKQ